MLVYLFSTIPHRIHSLMAKQSGKIFLQENPIPGKAWISICGCITLLFLFSSCASTRYVTHTKKSGVEQLLVSRALEKALQSADLEVKGSRVFIEISSLLSDQDPYVRKALEHWFRRKGALLTEKKKEADTIASVLVKCAGTDGNEFTFGIPSLPVPLMNITTPQINIISGSVQEGCAEMEVLLYAPEAGGKEKTMSLAGRSHFKKYMIILIPITSENIYPEDP